MLRAALHGGGQTDERVLVGAAEYNDPDELGAAFGERATEVAGLYDRFRLREATAATVDMARMANKYFNDAEPWKLAKTDLPAAGAVAVLLYAVAAGWVATSAAEEGVTIPPPAIDEAMPAASEVAVLAGGCFWGVQGVFQHVEGVTRAVSGYAGGGKADASNFRQRRIFAWRQG